MKKLFPIVGAKRNESNTCFGLVMSSSLGSHVRDGFWRLTLHFPRSHPTHRRGDAILELSIYDDESILQLESFRVLEMR